MMLFDDFVKEIDKEDNLLFQFIESYRNSGESVFLFGAGFCGRVYSKLMQRYQMPIEGIIDNYKDFMGDNRVLRMDEVARKYDLSNCLFIVSAPSKYLEIEKQLLELVRPDQIFNFPISRYDDPLNEPKVAREYLLSHKSDLRWCFDRLEDDFSRDVLVHTTLGALAADIKQYNMVWTSDFYYPPDIISFSEDEVMVELGANNGETLRDFIARCPNFKKVYCFEPGEVCMAPLKQITEPYGDRITVLPKAAWNKCGQIGFVNMDGIMNSKVDMNGGDTIVETAAVDEEVLEDITYMKMDVEGAEMMALEGAKNQIIKNKPKLAISVYHKKEDIIDIPRYLLELRPDYKFYMRYHGWDGTDVVLYAV